MYPSCPAAGRARVAILADEAPQLPVASDLASAGIINHHLTRPHRLQNVSITLVQCGEVLRDRISLTAARVCLRASSTALVKSGNHGISTPCSLGGRTGSLTADFGPPATSSSPAPPQMKAPYRQRSWPGPVYRRRRPARSSPRHTWLIVWRGLTLSRCASSSSSRGDGHIGVPPERVLRWSGSCGHGRMIPHRVSGRKARY
jgi:hypothetical protein